MIDVVWVTAFLDLPARTHDPAATFWAAVTGYTVSRPRGEHGEFATIVPPTGEPYLRTQRLGSGGPRLHLDLHVPDPLEAAAQATALGAREVFRSGYVVLASPGGLPVCLVPAHEVGERPPAAEWPGGSSRVDQVSLDLPPSRYDDELAFWSTLTRWRHTRSSSYDELGFLTPPPDLPLRLLLQRLVDDAPAVTAHLDLAVDHRAAEIERHVGLGAVVTDVRADWTVLRDPAGSTYCLTDRSPA